MQKKLWVRLPLFLMAALLIGLAGCNKTNSGPATTTLVYTNDTYTPIVITVNGASSTIPIAGSVSFTGTAGSTLTGTASTSGVTSTNAVVGQVITWTVNQVFPTSGSTTETLDVNSQYFFLKVYNGSIYDVDGVYVNYDLLPQTYDAITFGPGTYNIGYYQAYTNSNVRCIASNGLYWQANTTLPFTQNQEYIFSLGN